MLKISKRINRNLITMLICVIAAVGLWGYVAFVENPDMTKWVNNVPITISGEDTLNEKGFSIQSMSHTTIDVKVKAKRSQMQYLSADTITVTADVSRINRTGSAVVNVTVSLPSSTNASVAERKRSEVTFTIENLIDREFDITVNISAEPADGYSIHRYELDVPRTVTATAAESVISSIAEVLTTPIDLSSATANVVYPVTLTAYDANDNEVSDVTFDVSTVNVTFELYKTATVPVELSFSTKNPLLDVSYSPTEVEITGPVSTIDATESILTEDIDALSASDGTTLSAKLSVPSELALTSGQSSSVTVTFTAIEDENEEST
ncbi:MAG: hypothetical protein LUG52_05400 [Clostridia bacterium]|nr:hypothetical protein [Clostridia bacterium]